MNIIGISAYYHDSAACLVQDGRIVAAAQEERFTRRKNDFSFPEQAVAYCLRQGNIRAEELDFVAFYDKPFVKFERILDTYLAYAPLGIRSFLKAMPLWIKQKLWIKEHIARKTGFSGKIIFPEHHESHAASAFFPSPFHEAAFLTIDGVGEWATTSYGVGSDNNISIAAEMMFPHSLGLLYSAFTYFTGFKVNSGEYKLMGLAPYGEPKYKELILAELLDLKEDGSFKLNMKYFDYCAGLTMTSKRFADLFGREPRQPESALTQMDMDMARSVQEVTEEVVLRMVSHVHRRTGQKNLCMAGGVALNCVANGRILRESAFDDLWVQPAAGDAGGALGAALFTWHQYLGNAKQEVKGYDLQKGSYLGPEFSPEYIRRFLDSNNIAYSELSEEEIPEKIADEIAGQKVVGWFQGRMEYGPRALGNRSILAHPGIPGTKDRLNREVKGREPFRPFAPSCLAEDLPGLFDASRSESPFMSFVYKAGVEARRLLCEAVHVDGGARVQTVSRENVPLFYDLISRFKQATGVPGVLNTSFNASGEPIVCTPIDAVRCFERTGLDALFLGNVLATRKQR